MKYLIHLKHNTGDASHAPSQVALGEEGTQTAREVLTDEWRVVRCAGRGFLRVSNCCIPVDEIVMIAEVEE